MSRLKRKYEYKCFLLKDELIHLRLEDIDGLHVKYYRHENVQI